MIDSYVRKGYEYLHIYGEDFDKVKFNFSKYKFDVYFNGKRISRILKLDIEHNELTIKRFIETENDLWLKK